MTDKKYFAKKFLAMILTFAVSLLAVSVSGYAIGLF
jgi:hypothetical protein